MGEVYAAGANVRIDGEPGLDLNSLSLLFIGRTGKHLKEITEGPRRLDGVFPSMYREDENHQGYRISSSVNENHPARTLPYFTSIAFDTRGMPVPLTAPDPRLTTLQWLWQAENDERLNDIHRDRFRQLAALSAALATGPLDVSFDDPALLSLPDRLQVLIGQVHRQA